MTSSLRKSQENSIIKTDHGDSIRDSELQTHQTPTDTITDRKGISGLIYHATIYTIVDNWTTIQGPKVKRSVGGDVTIRRTWFIFYGPCRRQKTAMANRPPMRPPETTSIRNPLHRSNYHLSMNLPCHYLYSLWGSDNTPWPQSRRVSKIMVRATVFDSCSPLPKLRVPWASVI